MQADSDQKQMSSLSSSLSSHVTHQVTSGGLNLQIDYQNVPLCPKCTCLFMPCIVFTEKGQYIELCPCPTHQVTSVMFPFGTAVFQYVPRARTC